MVGIISGNSLGLQHSSAWVLGSHGLLGQPTVGRSGENLYVNASTGNLIVNRTDEMLFGIGPDAGFGRTYNSLGGADFDNSDEWHLSTTRRLLNPTSTNSGSVTRVDWDGSIQTYAWESGYVRHDGTGTGAFVNRDGEGAHDIIYKDGAGPWTWVDGATLATEIYAADGVDQRISYRKDTDGNRVDFSYTGSLVTRVDTTTSSHTEYTNLIYSGNNLTQLETHFFDIEANTDKVISRVTYGYSSNRLSTITVDLTPADTGDSVTYVTTYTYDGSNRVTGISQLDGTAISITYNGAGKVWKIGQTAVTGQAERVTEFTYGSGTTTIKDPGGKDTVITYDGEGKLLTVVKPAANDTGAQQTYTFTYDSATDDVLSVSLGSTNVFTYAYDTHGNRTFERDAAGNTLVRNYNARNELITETGYLVPDPDGAGSGQPSTPLITRYSYDSESHLRFVVSPEGRVTEHRYDSAGQRTATIQYTANTIDTSSLADDASFALTDTVLTTFLAANDDKATLSEFLYDFRGNLDWTKSWEAVDANGAGTGANTQIKYIYDQFGLLKQRIVGTTAEIYAYDGMGRLTAFTDFNGNLTATAYDDANLKTRVTLANDLVQTSIFNRAGELITFHDALWNETPIAEYTYDSRGRVRTATDSTGVKTWSFYDNLNRLTGEVDSDGSVVEYRYHDSNNQLAATIRYKNLTAASVSTLDNTATAFASVRPTADTANDRWEWRVYDNAQRLVGVVDAAGYATAFAYDGLSRLTKTTGYATVIAGGTIGGWKTTFPTSLPTISSSSTDRVARNFYDKDGLLIGALDGEGFLTKFVYDKAGRKIEAHAYSSATGLNLLQGPRDTLRATGSFEDLFNSVDDDPNYVLAEDRHSYFVYDARGLLRAEINGELDVVRYQYDALGYVSQVKRGQRMTGAQLNTFLVSARGPSNVPADNGEVIDTTDFVNDLYGKVVTEKRWVRNSSNTLVAETDTYTYDSMGQVTKIVRESVEVDPRTVSYRYDLRGNLTGVVHGEGSLLLAPAYDTTVVGSSSGETLNGGAGKDLIQGVDGGDTINGYGADDRLEGGAGNDILTGGTGLDVMVGGLGDDIFNVDNANDVALEASGQGNDEVKSSVSYTLTTGQAIETLSTDNAAGTSAINLGGNDLANTINGNAGANALYGFGGNDVLIANGGGDWLIGGTGDDTLTGGAGADLFVFALGDGADTISDFTIGTDLIDLRGFSGTNYTVTQSGANAIVALSGWQVTVLNTTASNLTSASFILTGGGGGFDQTINGTSSGETLNGGSGADHILGAGGSDILNGLGGNDRLEGGAMVDTIDGGDGDDVIIGGASNQSETLTGGAGADWFVFASGDSWSNLDLITDFTVGTDMLDITGATGSWSATQNGSDTDITVGGQYTGGVRFKLQGVTASTITSASFGTAPTGGGGSQPASPPAAATAPSDPGSGGVDAYATHGTVYDYDAAGRLRSKAEANGVDASGNRTYYYYNTDGRLIYEIRAVKQGANTVGEVSEYSYDVFGAVVATRVHADYVSATNMTALETARTSTNAVTSAALVTTTIDGYITDSTTSDSTTSTTYSVTGTIASFTDARGSVTTYVAYNAFREWLQTTTTLNGADSLSVVREFDNRGLVKKETVESNRISEFTYDAFGQVETTKDALGKYRYISYDLAGRVKSTTDALGAVTSYLYDARGLMTRKTDALNNQTNFTYDAFSRKIVSTSAESRAVTTISNAWGQARKVTDAAGTTDYTYNRDGNLTLLEDPLDHQTQHVYDNAGRLSYSLDALNRKTSYTYDKANRILTQKVDDGGLNLETKFTYDAKGQRVTVVDPANVTTQIAYSKGGDKVRVTVDPSGLNIQTNHVYDLAGRLVYTVDALNRPTQYVYDDVGNLLQRIDYGGVITPPSDFTIANVAAAITTAGLATHAETRSTRAVFDLNDRQVYAIDAQGAVTRSYYDDEGQAIRTVAYAETYGTAGNQTLATMDTWANASQRANNTANRITRLAYDALGRMAFSVDPEGYVTAVGYDKDSLTTKATRYAAKYQPTGDLTMTGGSSMPNWVIGNANTALDQVSRTVFDAAGRAVFSVDAESYVVKTDYDAAGRVTDVIRYAAKYTVSDSVTQTSLTTLIGTPSVAPSVTHYAYDNANQLTSTTRGYGATEASTTAWTYDGAGRVLVETRASGTADAATTTYTYDSMGRVLTETVQLAPGVTAVTTNQYDAAGRLAKVTDARGNAGYFYYDKLGRMTLQVDPELYATRTDYSISGQPIKVTRYVTPVTSPVVGTPPSVTTDTADAETQIEYDKLDRVTKVIDALGNYEQYTLSAFGDRVIVRNKLGHNTTNVFDKRGLLTKETLPITAANHLGNQVAVINSYEYDAFGNRTKLTEADDVDVAGNMVEKRVTTYAYDKLNRLTTTTGETVSVTSQTNFTTSNAAPVETIVYDARGNVIQTIKPDGAKTFFYYDALDRKTHEIDALGTYRVWTYDRRSNATAAKIYGDAVALPSTPGGTPPNPVDANNFRLTSSTYDLNNRLLTTSVSGVRVGSWNGSSYTLSSSPNATLTTSYEYDKLNNLTKHTDANGNASYSYYDKLGRKLAQVDAERYLTTYTHDTEGNVLTESRFATAVSGGVNLATATGASLLSGITTNAATDRITVFTYDKVGRRVTEARTGLAISTVNSSGALATTTPGTDPAAATTATITYVYNALGGVTKKTEATGEYTDYTFDYIGRQVSEKTSSFTDSTGATVKRLTETGYNGLGDVASTTVRKVAVSGGIDTPDTNSANWRVTTYTYDGAGRLASMTDAEDFTHYYGYDIAGRVVQDKYTRTKANGSTTVTEGMNYQYDLLGRVTAQRVGTLSGSWSFNDDYSKVQYNVFGEVAKKGIGSTLWQETFDYDKAGRMWKSTSGDGTTRIFLHDANGNVTMTFASAGTGDLSSYTSLEGAGQALDFLDNAGTIGSADISGVVMTIDVYDKRGQKTSTREPFRQLTYDIIYTTYTTGTIVHSRAYNAFGEVKSETDARGNTTDFTYNTMGRLIKKQSPYVNVTSESGNTTSQRPTEEYYYDASGRRVAVKDANGNTNKQTLLALSGLNGADPIVLSAFHADNTVFTNGVNVFGDVVKTTNELGAVETRTVDLMGRILTVTRPARTYSGAPAALVNSYAYDGLGQRIRTWNNQLNSTSSMSHTMQLTDYDPQGRVTSVTERVRNAANTAYTDYTTTLGYSWDSTIATSGLGTFGGWIKTTVNQAGLTQTYKEDYFGRTVNRVDFGSHTYGQTFDKAGRLLTDGTKSFSYFNTGLAKQGSDSWTSTGIYEFLTFVTATYGYDLDGNRVIERYDADRFHWIEGHYDGEGQWEEGYWQENNFVISNSTATWDAMNRMLTFVDTASGTGGVAAGGAADITNLYDAAGNVRRTVANYTRADNDQSATQDYWYRYDSMNRFVVTKGVLSGGAIVRGSTGVDIQYDAAGQRVVAISTKTNGDTHKEEYSYTEDGYLYETRMGTGSGSSPTTYLRARTLRDAIGRMTNYTEFYSGTTTASYWRTAQYDNKSQLVTESTMIDESLTNGNTKEQTTTYFYGAETGTNTWVFTGAYMGGVVTGSFVDTTAGPQNDTATKTTYVWFGDARADVITKDNNTNSSSNAIWNSTHEYGSDGRLVTAWIEDGDPRRVTYASEVNGQVLSRVEAATSTAGAVENYYYYFDGIRMGDVSNKGSGDTDYAKTINDRWSPGGLNGNYSDFDLSYVAVHPNSARSTTTAWTVRDGDTLQSIALEVWGDSSLWYQIADANGLTGAEPLVAGRSLQIPINVQNAHNSAVTFKPYDPNQALGSNAPSRKKPPKAPSMLGSILMVVIAVVVAHLVFGPVGGFMTETLGLSGMAATVATAAVAAAAGSIASQAVGLATNTIDKFDWKAVGIAALSAGITKGLSEFGPLNTLLDKIPSATAQDAVRGMTANVLTQGVSVATGLQEKFSWTGVAVAGVTSAVDGFVGRTLSAAPFDLKSTGWANRTLSGVASAVTGAGARNLLQGRSFGDNILAVLPDVIGASIGNAIIGGMSSAGTPPTGMAGPGGASDLDAAIPGKGAGVLPTAGDFIDLSPDGPLGVYGPPADYADRTRTAPTAVRKPGGNWLDSLKRWADQALPALQRFFTPTDYTSGDGINTVTTLSLNDSPNDGSTLVDPVMILGSRLWGDLRQTPFVQSLLRTADDFRENVVGQPFRTIREADRAEAAYRRSQPTYMRSDTRIRPMRGETIGANAIAGAIQDQRFFWMEANASRDSGRSLGNWKSVMNTPLENLMLDLEGARRHGWGYALAGASPFRAASATIFGGPANAATGGATRFFGMEVPEDYSGARRRESGDKFLEAGAIALTAADGGFLLAGRTGTVEGSNIVYRALNPANLDDLAAGRGIIASNPNGEWDAVQHVARPGMRGGAAANSPWISTTRSLEIAEAYEGGSGIVAIDLSRVNSLQVDVTRLASRYGSDSIAYHRAAWAQEVTIYRSIPPEAIVGRVY